MAVAFNPSSTSPHTAHNLHHACYVKTTDARIDEIVVRWTPSDAHWLAAQRHPTPSSTTSNPTRQTPDTTTSTWEFLITWECTNQEWGALLILLLGNRRVKTIRPA